MLPNIDFLFSYHLYTYHKRIKVHRRRCPYRFPMNYRNPIESESFAPPGSPWPTRSADFAPGIHSIIPYFHGERSSWTVWLVFSRLKNVYIYTHTHIYICTYTDIRVGSPRIARMHAAACTATSLPRVHPTVHTWKPSIRTCGRNCGTAAHPVGCVGCVRDYVRTSLIFTTPNTIRNVSDGKKRLISFSSSF